KIAILGDGGINQKVPENFWDEIRAHMTSAFKSGNYAAGLSDGIQMAGEQLKAHFPYLSNDKNELSDEISYG
ncbi:MAG: TPM domain-containing protein, partial [Bacteroidota bacterium]|nr:TPM domain-containing protein [Bacteroidota bacterium]MDX5468923.1 TPM domain-containing protein [Bacteroidota bacterium]